MRIDINKVKTTPPEFGFNFCVYGKPTQEIINWAHYWGFNLVESGAFTNIIINEMTNIGNIFNDLKPYKYVDGFSPNLNKHLHVGHFSNLIIANALQKLGVGEKFIAIFGDTLEGVVEPIDALENYEKHCNNFNYKVDDYYFASLMNTLTNESLLTDGEGDYEGVKIFFPGTSGNRSLV